MRGCLLSLGFQRVRVGCFRPRPDTRFVYELHDHRSFHADLLLRSVRLGKQGYLSSEVEEVSGQRRIYLPQGTCTTGEMVNLN